MSTADVVNALSGTVTPIATATNTPGKPIWFGNDGLGRIAFTPDSKTAYLVDAPFPGSSAPYIPGYVIPITIATNTPGPSIPVGHDSGAIVITPDGKTVYVLNYESDTVTPVTTATNTAGTPIPVGSNPGLISRPRNVRFRITRRSG